MSILDNILGTESEVISIEEDQRPHHYLWNFKHIEDVVPLLSNSFESIPLETIQNKNFIVIFGIAGRSGTIGFIDSTHSVLTFNVAIVPYDSEFKHLSLMSTSELHYLTVWLNITTYFVSLFVDIGFWTQAFRTASQGQRFFGGCSYLCISFLTRLLIGWLASS